MLEPSPANSPPSSGTSLRRFLSRAEAMTLLGMIACIASLFLSWPAPVVGDLPSLVDYRDITSRYTMMGQSFSGVNWPVKICAIAGGATLLLAANAKTRLPLMVFQLLCGL